MKELNLHLISDSTAGTVSSVARACIAQFEDVEACEHQWALVRSIDQLETIITKIEAKPGPVLHTLVNLQMQERLEKVCIHLGVPCLNPLERTRHALSLYLQQEFNARPGGRYTLNEQYFSRIEAIEYTLAHDDGKRHWELEQADIILVGPSRTSKSPTCIYLAYDGVRAANVPLVPGIDAPSILSELKNKLIVGLIIRPDRLSEIRQSRIQTMESGAVENYTDVSEIKSEIANARQCYRKHGWPVIDVSQRSIEETAAAILNIYRDNKRAAAGE